MDFDQAKNKSLKEIIDQSDKENVWAQTSFMKLIDAKIGEEISGKILALIGSMVALNENLQKETKNIIKSNEALAKTNEKYTKALCWLTGGLVFVGFLQFFALIIPLILGHTP